MTFWAIRQKSTGHFLPEIGPKTGYSFTSPTSIDLKQPRLFRTEKEAKGSMRAWLRGRHKAVFDPEDYGVVGTEVERDPTRDPNDFEVVELELTPVVTHHPHCRGCGCHT